MAQEVIRQSCRRNDRRTAAKSGEEKSETAGPSALSFQRQRETNLQVKGAMAKELAAMGLTEDSIQQILHLEDEIPF